ncbi:GAF domain-containing protein [Pontibacter ruber]|nr:GAF domain-containing protein [Pontibacter ruber]
MPTAWSLEEQELLDEAVTFTNDYVGDDFFRDVSVFISEKLAIDYVVIGKFVQPDNEKIRTLIAVHDGEPFGNFDYDVKNTPCEHVLINGVCFYPSDVADHFPEDVALQELSIQSYMGTPLTDVDDNRIGLIVLMNIGEIRNPNLVQTFLTIISPRIEEEILKGEQQAAG